MCLKLTTKFKSTIPSFFINFERIQHINLLFFFITLNIYLSTGSTFTVKKKVNKLVNNVEWSLVGAVIFNFFQAQIFWESLFETLNYF